MTSGTLFFLPKQDLARIRVSSREQHLAAPRVQTPLASRLEEH
jgi:hypothetical protein